MSIPSQFKSLLPMVFVGLAGCGSDTTGPSTPPELCTAPTSVDLTTGGHRIISALGESSCILLEAGEAEREYLVVTYSGTGRESSTGVQSGYQIRSQAAGTDEASLVSAARATAGLTPPDAPAAFHQGLRRREADLARSAPVSARLLDREPTVLGQVETFRTCKSLSCSATEALEATARYVGERGVIYTDNQMSTGADVLSAADLQHLGEVFDEWIYPLDTTAFGAESDIDGNGQIAILITPRVNALTPDCSDGRIVGYFFGGDLLSSYPGTNAREVFFAFAPQVGTATCPTVSRSTALKSLPPVLIHELQHMISFNQRVLKHGNPDETVWLNEGLSHFAEELGQRFIPDEFCPHSETCFSEFARGNTQNAYMYLEDPEASFLVAPVRDGPGIAGRGAGWLFVRWLADHFAADTLRGTQLTRGLVSGSSTGAANVSAITGQPFASLVGEWHLANWLDNLPGMPATGRLRYRTWNFRDFFDRNSPGAFLLDYPLVPSVSVGNFVASGTLRAGSGQYLRVIVPAGEAGITVRVAGPGGTSRISSELDARFAVARIR